MVGFVDGILFVWLFDLVFVCFFGYVVVNRLIVFEKIISDFGLIYI